jgi:phage shock protein PspC (stress-responsive transcriptional regulator)
MADQEKKSAQKDPGGDRRLLRSADERMLWGVAGGLGEYLRVDPTLVRLGFAVAAFFGGLGILAYLVMAVVVPQDDGSGKPVSGRRPPTAAIVLLVLVALVAIPGPLWGGGDGWWWGFAGPLWIGVLILAGVLAYRAISGRSRRGFRGESGQGTRGPSAATAGETAETEVIDQPPRIVRGIGIAILIVAGIVAVCCVAVCAAWLAATGNGEVVAGIVIALGLALAATAFISDVRRAAPWLLAGALTLALPAGAVAAADIRFDGGIGERNYRPASVTDLPSDGYDLGVGRLVVDLRDLPFQPGQTISLDSELGIGQMVVSVPSNVCVDADARGKAGHLLVQGETSSGIDPDYDSGEPQSDAPRLDLDAEIQLGEIVVTDRDPDDFDDRGPGPDGGPPQLGRDGNPDHEEDPEEAAAAREVCGR